ncbi:hypothetical protein [Mycolicibacterium cosmeticum]
MTLLHDWLGISPLTSQTVKSLVWGVLRGGEPAVPPRRKPKAMRRGVERC